jgi:hypothetical protein
VHNKPHANPRNVNALPIQEGLKKQEIQEKYTWPGNRSNKDSHVKDERTNDKIEKKKKKQNLL